jgi:hypothetical protein
LSDATPHSCPSPPSPGKREHPLSRSDFRWSPWVLPSGRIGPRSIGKGTAGCGRRESQLASAPTNKRIDACRGRARGWIRRKANLDVPREPSVVGIDGSYQVHRLTAVDLCAAATVAVEGTSREAKRHREKPHHRIWVESISHSKNVTNTLRGLPSRKKNIMADVPMFLT